MAEASGNPTELPEPKVTHRRSFSLVWLIPILTILIGGWLTVKTLSEQGPVCLLYTSDAADE